VILNHSFLSKALDKKRRRLSMGSERVKLSEGAVILLVTMRVINISESSFRPQHGQFERLAPTRSPVFVNKKKSQTVRVVFTKYTTGTSTALLYAYHHASWTRHQLLVSGSSSDPLTLGSGKQLGAYRKPKLSGRHRRCDSVAKENIPPPGGTWMPNITTKSAYEIN